MALIRLIKLGSWPVQRTPRIDGLVITVHATGTVEGTPQGTYHCASLIEALTFMFANDFESMTITDPNGTTLKQGKRVWRAPHLSVGIDISRTENGFIVTHVDMPIPDDSKREYDYTRTSRFPIVKGMKQIKRSIKVRGRDGEFPLDVIFGFGATADNHQRATKWRQH